MRRPFVGLSLAAAAGIALADNVPPAAMVGLLCAIALALAAMRWSSTLLVLLAVSAVFFCLHASRRSGTPADALLQLTGNSVTAVSAVGQVASEPKIENSGDATFLLQLRSISREGAALPASALVRTRWRGTAEVGDRLALFGTLQLISPPRNPGEFDLRAYLARRDVRQSLMVRYPENAHVVQKGNVFSLRRAASNARSWMQQTLSRDLESSPETVAMICGTALGLRHQTPDDIEEPFQQTGTLHLFAVAGLHVGMVASLLWIVASVLRVPRKIATGVIIPLLFFYAAVTGLHTASIRAALMAAILLGGTFFDRKVFALNSLAAAAFLILLWDSHQLFTSGFQLSFAVVGTIIMLTEPVSHWLHQRTAPDPFLPRSLLTRPQRIVGQCAHHLWNGTAVSLAAWAGSLFLIVWYFHLLTPVSLLANLVIVPIAYFVLALAMLSIVSAPFSTALSIVFNNANWALSQLVLGIVHLFAAAPGGHVYLAHPGTSRPAIGITVLDEGAGAAAHLHCGHFNWMIDCGPQRTYERTLKAYLHDRGVNRLEGMLLTHGDAKHIGGAAAAVIDFAPREIYDNPLDVRSLIQRRFRAALQFERLSSRSVAKGDRLFLGHEISAEILYPPSTAKVKKADDAPVILRVAIDDGPSILFESDAGAAAEAALITAGVELRSDILVKGQHVSGGSGTGPFLDAVKPRLIIATSSAMPMRETIGREWAEEVVTRGIKLFRQDETGAVEIDCAGGQWRARAYLTGETFRSDKR
ncbi:MAG: ComEC/Rec2 family competence protein [Verrucomicrobiota bacterium]